MSKILVALSFAIISSFSTHGFASEPSPTPVPGEYPRHAYGPVCLNGQELPAGGFTLGLYINSGIVDTNSSRLDAQTVILSGSIGYTPIPGNLSRTINGYASIALQVQSISQKDKTQHFMGTGTLALGPTVLQDLMQRHGSSICFSTATIQTLYYGSTLYGGYVILGLSNGQFYPILF